VIGVWIFYPRTSLYQAPGIGVATDCSAPPKVSFSVSIWDIYRYEILMLFENMKSLKCQTIRLITPYPLVSMSHIGSDYADRPFPQGSIFPVHTDLDQPVFDIKVAKLGEPLTAVRLMVEDVRQDAFEKFRVILPPAKIGLDQGLVRATMDIWAVTLQS